MVSAGEVAAVAVLAVAAVWDLKTRKIPNWLTFPAMALGVLFGALAGRATWHLESLGICLVAGFLLWLFGVFAEGDAKLFAATGALAGADMSFLGLALACVFLLLVVVPLRVREVGLRRWLVGEKAALFFVFAGGRLRCEDAPAEFTPVPFAPFYAFGGAVALALLKAGVV